MYRNFGFVILSAKSWSKRAKTVMNLVITRPTFRLCRQIGGYNDCDVESRLYIILFSVYVWRLYS